MKTSCFKFTPNAMPGAIAISLYPPRWRKCLHYPKLAPSAELLKTYKDPNAAILYHPIEKYYTVEYFQQLVELDARAIWEELHTIADGAEPILLCYETPGQFCHRQLVAKWFEIELGEAVEEVQGTAHQSKTREVGWMRL